MDSRILITMIEVVLEKLNKFHPLGRELSERVSSVKATILPNVLELIIFTEAND